MQRVFRILFVFIFCSSGLFAQYLQKLQIDSAIRVLKTDKEDTTKVNDLNKLGDFCRNMAGKDTSYPLQAIELAQKLGYKKGIAKGYWSLGGYNWIHAKNNARAKMYFLKAANMYKEAGDLTHEGALIESVSEVYDGMDSFSTSLKYKFQALQILEINKKNRYLLLTLNNIGATYTSLGDYPNALKYYLEALNHAEKPSEPKDISYALDNVGDIYTGMKDYKNAMVYLDSALKISRKIGDISGQKIFLVDIAIVYRAEKKYPEALDYAFQALKLSYETESPISKAYSSEEIGEIYKETGHYEMALKYEEEAQKASEGIKYANLIIKSRGAIGEIYIKEKNYKEAEKYLFAAIDLARSSHDLEDQKNYELDLSQLYSTTEEYKESLDHYTQYALLKDSLYNQNASRQIGKIEAEGEYDKQLATQQADQDNAKAIADVKSKRQEIISLFTALIAIIIALIAFIIYRSLRTAKKEKIMVEKEKILMELKALRAQMNPHFIFNAINSIQNSITGNDMDAAQKHLSKFSKLIRMVLENSSYENIPLADEIKMLELYLELETVRFSSRFQYKIIVDPSVDKEKIFISPLIIQPYVENAIWHGLMHLKDRQGEVTIHFETRGNHLKCTIDDNGIGRMRSIELKKNSVHKSMGLSITRERIEIMNTLFKSKMSITFTDKLNDGGTRVELLMPLIANT